MKKIMILIIVSVLLLVSVGGCWVGRDYAGRNGRSGGGLDKSEGQDKGQGMEQRR